MINEKPLAKPENRVPEAIKDLKMAEGHLDVLELTQLPTYPVMTGRSFRKEKLDERRG